MSGDASLAAVNDAARVSVGVRARATSRRAALVGTSRRLNATLAALRGKGVAPRDLRTGSVTVIRVRVKTRRGRIVRFEGRSGVRATIRQASRAGAVVGAVTAAGGFISSGPSYFVSDSAALRRRALVAAFGDAQAKAAALASRAGLALGRPLSIRDSTFVGSVPETTLGEKEATSAPAKGESQNDVPTQPGASRITGTVYVVFAAS